MEGSVIAADSLTDFYERLHAKNMMGLWEMFSAYGRVVRDGTLAEPPQIWRWRDVYPFLLEASEIELDPKAGVERRNLVFTGQGAGLGSTTPTMGCGVQYLLPGETAQCHRHDAAAIRFVIQGRGAYTAVEGERLYMEPGDLILTPHWTWHEHANEGNEPVIWMDGLDSGLTMNFLKAQAWEAYPERHHPNVHDVGYSRRRVGTGLVRPLGKIPERTLPFIYPWSEVYPELLRQKEQAGLLDPFDGVALEYANPVTGGPTLPTLSCRMHLFPAGQSTRSHRHMSNFIYRVFRGSGWSEVGGRRLEWEAGDCFVVPQWIWHSHGAASGEDALLFSMNDQPILEPFDLYREEAQ